MLLSVVIPVYNEKNTIEKIVDRVKHVSGVEKDLIIVDDASTDGTRDVLRRIKERNPEIKILFKETNSGKGATLKEGFRLTSGDYVIVQDADLEYDPEDYKVLFAALSKNSAQVVYKPVSKCKPSRDTLPVQENF